LRLRGSLDGRVSVAARPVILSFLGGSPLLLLWSRGVQGFGRSVAVLGVRRVRRFCRNVGTRIVLRVSLVDFE
jgi:hypothetical protein